MTPKQAAKSFVQFSKHAAKQDPQLRLARFFIPRFRTVKRSRPIHGLVDGVFHAKKYFCPSPSFNRSSPERSHHYYLGAASILPKTRPCGRLTVPSIAR